VTRSTSLDLGSDGTDNVAGVSVKLGRSNVLRPIRPVQWSTARGTLSCAPSCAPSCGDDVRWPGSEAPGLIGHPEALSHYKQKQVHQPHGTTWRRVGSDRPPRGRHAVHANLDSAQHAARLQKWSCWVHAKTSSCSSLFLPMNRRSSLRSGRGLRPQNRRFLCLRAHPFESVSSIWGGVSALERAGGLFRYVAASCWSN